MAIYYCNVGIIGRSSGKSVVAAAAYRSGGRLHDERSGITYDYSDRADVLHAAVMLPAGAPDALADRSTLWNAVEAAEKRKDAQLARQVEFALPRELGEGANIELARTIVQAAFVEKGMIADLAVHAGKAADGGGQPHAHVLLTMREVGPDGFGPKNRDWNGREALGEYRELLAKCTNEALALAGRRERVDHRSYAERGMEIEGRKHLGPGGAERTAQDRRAAALAAENEATERRNGERLLAEPGIVLDMLTGHASTFTRRDAARIVSTYTADREQFDRVMARLDAHPELVRVGEDRAGRDRFTTRAMLATEARLAADAGRMTRRRSHGTRDGAARRAAARAGLGREQAEALAHVTKAGDLSLVVGFAGTGKSTMLGAAREVWEAEGYRVRGAALSGIAAEGLEGGSGIGSRTIASLEHAWARDRDRLERGDVLVVDEAGMVGSRQMGRMLAHAEAAGAKVVLVGDPAQLQAIEAGAAFRALVAEHGAARLTEVRRQHADWQRAATRELATGRTAMALDRYAEAGMLHEAADRAEARAALVERWDASRREAPARTQAILAATRAEVAELNALARGRVRASGDLTGEDVDVRTERGPRAMAAGERVMFLRNDRGMNVKNGTLGTVRAIGGGGASLTVQLDGSGGAGTGRVVTFDVRDYASLEHGYAATVHKSQGITVDRAHVLATPAMGREGTYVGMSRQRERVDVTYAREDYADRGALARGLSRDTAKDTTLDYAPGRRAGATTSREPAPAAREFGTGRGAAAVRAMLDAERASDEAARARGETPPERRSDFGTGRGAAAVQAMLDAERVRDGVARLRAAGAGLAREDAAGKAKGGDRADAFASTRDAMVDVTWTKVGTTRAEARAEERFERDERKRPPTGKERERGRGRGRDDDGGLGL